ncbi:MAG: SulP family inorganic anion transporter [Marinobacter sp.]
MRLLIKRSLPGWLQHYQRSWLRPDLIGGLTVAAMAIPKAMAYAVIAGLPIQTGLYTALAATMVYPLLGSSRPLSVTTTSAIAMLSAAVVAAAAAQTSASPVAIAATLALLVGAILVLARILRLGFLANFISLPVLVGFQTGVGLVIIIGQIGAILGVYIESHSVPGILRALPAAISQTHVITLSVALFGLAVMLALPRLFPRLSGPLVWVVLSIFISALFGLEAMGVKTVGAVPSGLPVLALPDLSLATVVLPGAFGIALMSFTESVAAARTYTQRTDPPVNPNRELLAIGAANLASAAVGGLPAGGGTSQTNVADNAGVRSQMAQWVNGGVVLLCLLVFSNIIGLLPKAALGALIIIASIHMIKPDDFRAIARIRPMEFSWAIITMAGVLLIGTLEGILIAVAISVISLFYQAVNPPVYAVVYNRSKDIFRRFGDDSEDISFPGLLILRTEGRINFANASNTREKMQALVMETSPKVIALECSGIPDFEYTALSMLMDVEEDLAHREIELWLVSVNPDLRLTLKRSLLEQKLGPERIFFNLKQALEAWEKRTPERAESNS